MAKEEIINYIMQSPENTNPNVLRGMLENNGQGGGSGGGLLVVHSVEGFMDMKAGELYAAA